MDLLQTFPVTLLGQTHDVPVAGAVVGGILFMLMLAKFHADVPAPPSKSGKKKKKANKKKVEGTEKVAAAPKKKASKEAAKPKKAETKKAAAKKTEAAAPKKKAGKAKKVPAPVKKVAEPVYSDDDDDDDSIFFRGPITTDVMASAKPSKSAARRARAKENLRQSAATGNKPVIDSDGFQTHVVKRRSKKPEGAKAAAVAQANADVPGDNTVSTELAIASRHYGLIIGAGGATLKKIQEGTDCRISLPDKESDKTTVTVQGTKDNVKRCEKVLDSLINKGFSSITDPGINSSTIACPGKALGILIGPGGSNIKKIQATCNVKINTPDRNSESDKVTISGEKGDVKKAKEAIKMLIEHGFSDITHEGWTMIVVPFPVDDMKLLIGPGGHTIKSIQGDSKARVNVPGNKIPGTTVDLTIVGTTEACDKAKKQVLGLLNKKDMQFDKVDPYEIDENYDSQEEYFR